MSIKIIVALDFNEEGPALELVNQLDSHHCALKVGSEMFTLLGPTFVRQLIGLGFKVFLDLKFHDIPNTVASACSVAADLGVWMLNVHASGGLAMMRAAYNAIQPYGKDKPLLIGVTVLTSMNASNLPEIGLECALPAQVERLTALTHQAGLDGVVCSALEVPVIKTIAGQTFLTVTPGIRLAGDSMDDQARVVTPKDAVMMGSDFLVIGRSITQAKEPRRVVETILASLTV